MAVNVSTELLKSGGNEVINSFTKCEGPYQAVASASCDLPVFNSFKDKLQSKFTEFGERSNIFSSRIRDCAICLEEIDSLIASGASGNQLISANNVGFAALGGITVATKAGIDFLDKTDNVDDSKLKTDSGDTDVAYYGSNLKPKNNNLIAHRGHGIADNTVEAFKSAGEAGYWGCETDVRFDANGNLICSHNAVKSGENPPSFEEYLDICKEYGMTAIIDLKYADGAAYADSKLSPEVIKTIQEKGMIDSCVLQTNNLVDVSYIRETSDDARIWLLVNETSDKNMQLITKNNVECVNFDAAKTKFGDLKASIEKLNNYGIDSCVWRVNKYPDVYTNAGATYIMTDELKATPYQEGDTDFNNIAK